MLKHHITISYYTLCLMFRHSIVNKYHQNITIVILFVNKTKGFILYPRPCGSFGRTMSIWLKRWERDFSNCYISSFVSKWQLLATYVPRSGGSTGKAKCSLRISVGRAPLKSLDSHDVSCLRSRWILPNSTITYDSLPLSHGLGSFDLPSGEWKSEVTLRFYAFYDVFVKILFQKWSW